jgi:hypothetical protein
MAAGSDCMMAIPGRRQPDEECVAVRSLNVVHPIGIFPNIEMMYRSPSQPNAL